MPSPGSTAELMHPKDGFALENTNEDSPSNKSAGKLAAPADAGGPAERADEPPRPPRRSPEAAGLSSFQFPSSPRRPGSKKRT
eukprot:119495-Pyramimonas_sp.AAC.1